MIFKTHTNVLPSSKQIRGLFITHQHYDHFLGMKYLKDNGYSIECLIYSPYERRYNDSSVQYEEWQEFSSYVNYFASKGTRIFTPFRQSNVKEPWWTTNGIEFRLLGPVEHIAKSQTREIHDASLVIHATLGKRACLLTGDSSDTSLSWIASNTINFCNDILHASHHGSINGADLTFIKGANANIQSSPPNQVYMIQFLTLLHCSDIGHILKIKYIGLILMDQCFASFRVQLNG